jgi:glycosyltransferase involved in cell wall biosynthesis
MTSISIVMPVRNAGRFLEEALASVLSQTFPDFELIVVLDRSTDESEAMARGAQRRDDRIRVIDNSGAGLVDALNNGADAARGDFLARLDADDRMAATRLERQYDFLHRHPDIVATGSAATVIDDASRPVDRIRVPASDAALRRRLVRGNPFVHSSMTMRRQAFIAAGRYRNAFPLVEDYDLWLRLARQGRLMNFAEPLVDYRRHAGTLSVRFAEEQALARHLCILDWKRGENLVDEATHRRRRDDLVALFARSRQLDEDPSRLEASDMAQFKRALPILAGGESRHLSRLVARGHRAGRVSLSSMLGFEIAAKVTSRIAFAASCRPAVRRLSIDRNGGAAGAPVRVP